MPASKTQRELSQALDPEIKRLHALVDQQAETIDTLRAKRTFSLPNGRTAAKGKRFVRLIIPDSHGSHIDPIVAKAMLDDVELLKPKEVVMLGDHLDCGGFLAQHHTLGFVPETDYTFAQDAEAANEFLNQIQKRTGKVDTYYIEGNHEHRITKELIKWTVQNRLDAQYMANLFSTPKVLSLEARGIQFIERGKQYCGLSKRGTIKLGKCMFAHGTRCGIYAAKQTLEDFSYNVVTGHTHRISSFFKETVNGIMGSWQFGCLCFLHPLYGDTKVSNWAHAYGIQIVDRDGTFLTITVPIIDGASYLRSIIATG